MSNVAELELESPRVNAKNPSRGARKFGSGERGFQTGTYPRSGPFEIYMKRDVVQSRGSDEDAREGRTFYVAGLYPKRKPPIEGWMHYLAGMYGAGTFRVHHDPDDEGRHRQRGIIHVPAKFAAKVAPVVRDDEDDDDDGEDGDERDNPPMSAAAHLTEQMRELDELRATLAPAPATPSMIEKLAPMMAQALIQVMTQAQRGGAPAAAVPNPPPAPAAPDPFTAVRRFAEARGITAEQAIAILADQTLPPEGDDEGDEGDDENG